MSVMEPLTGLLFCVLFAQIGEESDRGRTGANHAAPRIYLSLNRQYLNTHIVP